MVIRTSLEREGDGAVVVKRADAADRELLRLEADRLARASHPGVVQLLSSTDTADGWELRTAHAGRPVSSLDRLEPREAARVVASAAATLADLHQLGLVHGRIDGSHVLVGPGGRGVLCGLGAGQDGARPEDDVAALGSLLEHLLDTGGDDAEPIPAHRWRPRPPWAGWERRSLLLVADQATAEPATRRPTARRLAAAIAEVVPEVGAPGAPPSDASDDPGIDPMASLRAGVLVERGPRWRAPRPAVWAVAMLVVVVVIVGGRPTDRRPSPGATPATVGAEPTSPATTEKVRTAEVAASVLRADGRRYRVGQAGDEVLVEDWDCDGMATPALLRPSTGEVYVFPRWVEEATLAVEPILTVPGAVALESRALGDGCADLAARTRDGDLVPVIGAGP